MKKQGQKKRRHRLNSLWAVLLGLFISLSSGETGFFSWGSAGFAQQYPMPSQTSMPTVPDKLTLAQQEAAGRQLYQAGRYEDAIALWQNIAQAYALQPNPLAQASALSNLSLSYQQLGQWDNAQVAITESLRLVTHQATDQATDQRANQTANQLTDQGAIDPSDETSRVMAQALMTFGSLNLAIGQPEQALENWQQAAETYRQGHDENGYSRAQINQALALRDLGFYRRALEKLTQVTDDIKNQEPSSLQGMALRRLGEYLQLNGQTDAAQEILNQSLRLAEQYADPAEISATRLSLGRAAQSQGDTAAAQNFYEQATEALAPTPLASQQVPIQLAQLSLYVEQAQWAAAKALWPTIQAQFAHLPASRNTMYFQIDWANSLMKIAQQLSSDDSDRVTLELQMVAQQLQQVIAQARAMSDTRAEAYALGTLGKLYEQNQQWAIAQTLTQEALTLSHRINATDIAYQWQWQLGRIWQAPTNPVRSIQRSLAAYHEAVETLASLRTDLAATGSTSFSFTEKVEPVYREFISLLLQTDRQATDYQQNLSLAKQVIESLHIAELDNYFQEACTDNEPVAIDQADPNTAVIYTVVFENSLSVILQTPQQPLHHFSMAVSANEVSQVAKALRQQLVIRSRRDYLPTAQTLYSWLIAPARAVIDSSGVQTLVFVLDGPLQNVPMAALYDGDRFLIEDYAVSLTPGLLLTNLQPWKADYLNALIAGITESHRGQAPLPSVSQEIQAISSRLHRTTILLNDQFTKEALSNRLKKKLYPIVHIATHGQFGSTAEDTYLSAWDEQINVRDVSQMLQARLGSREGIALLVLSACETASGSEQTALGLAGVAIKAGASSTLGTLWAVDDETTSQFIGYFYEQLTHSGATRATAIREAQLKLLSAPQSRHPIYWAPYVLLGSWL